MGRVRVNVALLLAAGVSLAAGLGLTPERTHAMSWCAQPIWAHEWGVVVFGANGVRTAGPGVPANFHTSAGTGGASAADPPVRHGDSDSGDRFLPVMQFFTYGSGPIPIGLEVGVRYGTASAWYPQVDHRTPASDANGPLALASRTRLLADRARRSPFGPPLLLGRDPTRQLAWDHLELTDAPTHAAAASTTPWVDRLRAMPAARWVNGARESERFVFYEANTSETAAITIERGPEYGPGRRHLILRNRSTHPVHDVVLVHREAAGLYVITAPQIPAGQTAGFILEDHRADAAAFTTATDEWLRASMNAETAARYDGCVMQRDPAVPVETATGHSVFGEEGDVILDTWGARFFNALGTNVVYREDTAHLDEVMPLSLYTDMFHFIVLNRLGLALVENLTLP